MYCIYILYSEKLDRFYVGSTNNLERRLSEHNRKKGKFTDSGIPWKIVYSEHFDTNLEAIQREREIKDRKSRKYILELIQKSGR